MLRAILLKNPKNPLIRAFTTAIQEQPAKEDAIEYPPIIDYSLGEKFKRKKLAEYDFIKKCPTIEEKIIQLNMPRYWGFKCLMMGDEWYPYNALPWVKYSTKTDFQEVPLKIEDPAEAKRVEDFYNLIKPELVDALEFEIGGYEHPLEDKSPREVHRMKASAVVNHLNRLLTRTLGADNGHLYESDVDYDPRIEAFWFVGGMTPPKKLVDLRRRRDHLRPFRNDPVPRGIQFKGRPLLAIRHQNPLQPFDDVNFEGLTEQNKNIPYDEVTSVEPHAAGWTFDHQHGVIVPGFWPGNVREYGLISFYDRSILIGRKKSFGEVDHKEAIHSLGINASYAYAYGQACYHGFSTFNDITYPLSAQTVITDGQIWNFYRFQLNTTISHTEINEPNYKFNQCWGTKETKLYENIDEKGKLEGLNDDVLKQLIRFYLAEPKARDYEMKPYLDSHEKKIADIEDVKRRSWLEKTYKHLVSNRPRQILVPEIYHWEKIYKIDHNTRPMQDKRMRFYNFGINPFQRRLDEHLPRYIPRDLRENGIHDKNRREATYYPLNHRSNKYRTMSNSEFGAARDGVRRKYDRFRKSHK